MSKSIAEQSTAELGGPLSVLTRQKNDHVELDRLLKCLVQSRGTEQEHLLLSVCRLVFPHAFAEEAILWPVMRRVLDDWHVLTLEVEQEHQEVNELVNCLETMDRNDDQWDAVLDRLVKVLRDDVRDEEDELFPRLQSALPAWQLQVFGALWEVLRRTAPTRAHPVVARRPPGNVVAAVPLAIIDRTRDYVDSRALSRSDTATASRWRSISTALGRAASRVEHFSIMSRGEHPATHIKTAR